MIRRFILVLLSFAFCWGIPEILVRIADPPLQQYRDLQFGRDPNSPLLFMRDPRLHWKLRPNAEVLLQGRNVRTGPQGLQGEAARAGERTLLVLGDSTAFGWGVGEGESFSELLQARLDGTSTSALAAPHLRVLNAAVPGYSSFQVRLQAEALIPRWRPAVVVLCVGNNDAWPVARSDREVDTSRRLAAVLESALSKSHLLVWASERLRPHRPATFTASTLAGSVARVSVSEYADNLRAIVSLARDAGARVILLGSSVNLYFPPDRLELQPGAEARDELQRSVGELSQRGAFEAALERTRAAAAAAPESFYPIYLEGIVLTLMGRTDAGLERLEEALERNPFPERSKRSYREAAREVAERAGAAYLDVNALFRDASAPDPVQAATFYLDWCHPTPAGHRLIADALFEQIQAAK